MKAPDPALVLVLAEKHVQRYTYQRTRARNGHRGYRLEECEQLLAIWQSIMTRGGRWAELTEEERAEVEDAIEDEE